MTFINHLHLAIQELTPVAEMKSNAVGRDFGLHIYKRVNIPGLSDRVFHSYALQLNSTGQMLAQLCRQQNEQPLVTLYKDTVGCMWMVSITSFAGKAGSVLHFKFYTYQTIQNWFNKQINITQNSTNQWFANLVFAQFLPLQPLNNQIYQQPTMHMCTNKAINACFTTCFFNQRESLGNDVFVVFSNADEKKTKVSTAVKKCGVG